MSREYEPAGVSTSRVPKMGASDEGRQGRGSTAPASAADSWSTGFRSQFLAGLNSGTAVAYRGEPTGYELALLLWRMSEEERRDFAGVISRITGELRAADGLTIQARLNDLNGAATRIPAGDSLEIHTEESRGS